MKKIFASISILLLNFVFLSAAKFQIKNYNFDITGAGFKFLGQTNEYALLKNYPIDTKTTFETKDDFEKYLTNYKKTLMSSRAFDQVEIETVYNTEDENSFYDEESFIEVTLNFKIVDSHHLLFMPYPKYSSNDGFTFKLKSKDSNFLGSLNTMSSELNFNFSDKGLSPGLSFAFDYPFKMGIFDVQWVNDYSASYTIGKSMPEWTLKSGFDFILPYDNHSFKLSLYQYFNRNEDFLLLNDDMYFREEAAFSVPLNIFTFENYTNLTYTPTIAFNYYWDYNGINIENDSIQSKSLSFSQNLANSKIIWENCFRTGYSFSLTNSYTYYFDRQDFSPSVSFDAKLYYNFITSEKRHILEQFGINFHLYTFIYATAPGNKFYYGEQIGSYMRGIIDNSFFGNTKPAYTASSAIIFSLDLPHHMFTTNFKKDLLNFNLQISPFIDAALTLNRTSGTIFNAKEGYYCAGAEMLVFPLKWSSYTIRASLGFDVLKVLKEDSIISGLKKYHEIYIGIGVQY